MNTAENPLLSVVITSYTMQRFKDICDLFDSIKAQTYQSIEVVFVAEHSRGLYERVKEFISREPAVAGTKPPLAEPRSEVLNPRSAKEVASQQLSISSLTSQPQNSRLSTQDSEPYTIGCGLLTYKLLFNEGEPGLSAARNLGIKHAQGDIIAFVDDDVVLFPNWAEEVVKSFDDDSIIGSTGPALPLWEDEKSMSWFPKEFYWIISCTAWFDCNEKREMRNAWGMNMAFKREAFELCGLFRNEFGFHKGLFAEDNEFSLRVKAKTGQKIVFCPEMKLWHRVHKYRISYSFIKERAYWIGRSRRNLNRLNGRGDDKDLLDMEHQLLRRIFTRFFPEILKDLFKNPLIAWQKLSTASIALLFVTVGFLFPAKNEKKDERLIRL